MADFLNVIELATVQLSEADGKSQSWVHALPFGSYKHPVFGDLNMTPEKVTAFAESVKNKVRGIDPSINYAHQGDGEAAGWVKDAKVETDGLHLLVEWTTHAAQKIKDKAFRYFSAEFYDKWTSPTGAKFQDVLFGGALTNRPFMKDLLPINLSENSINYAFELVEAINKAKENEREEVEVDLKKLCEVLGLPEGSTEEQVLAKLAESKPADKDKDKKAFPTVPKYTPSADLKRLAEENPLVSGLLETVEAQLKALTDHNERLREAEVNKKLAEFDNTNIVLTPRAKDLVHDYLMESPVELHERFWDILGLLKSSSGLMVELGERAGVSVRYGRSKDSATLFMDTAKNIATERKITLSEAMDEVARGNPELYNSYRTSMYISNEQ